MLLPFIFSVDIIYTLGCLEIRYRQVGHGRRTENGNKIIEALLFFLIIFGTY